MEDLWIRGAITLLNAKIKTGKSTFVGQCISAVLAGDMILGRDTSPATICWITEEGVDTFGAILLRSRLEGATDLHVLQRFDVPRSYTWPNVMANVVIPKMMEVGATGLVVDTISRWAKFKGNEENDSGAAAEAMEPLEILRDGPLHPGIFLVHHDSKGEGRIVQDSGRGSSALGGAADILLNLYEPDATQPTRRILQGVSRWKTIKLGMEWDEIGRRYIGADAEENGRVEKALAKQLILDLMAGLEPASVDVLNGLLPSLKRTTLDRALKELEATGQVTRAGAGVRGNPFLFSL